VKWPAVGPGDRGQGEIVYQHGPELVLLDLGTEKGRPVKVTIPRGSSEAPSQGGR
jgi:hypothetical protein